MTDDIVTRLRDWTYWIELQKDERLVNEAADEIERLRAALQGIEDFNTTEPLKFTAGAMRAIARAALAREKKGG